MSNSTPNSATKNDKPVLGSENVTWDLSLFYSAPTDPAIDADIGWCRSNSAAFETKYKGTIAQISKDALLEMLTEMEALQELLSRLYTYSFLNHCAQTQDAKAGALYQKIVEAGSEIGTHFVFVELEWCALSEERVEELLADERLAEHRHHLRQSRRHAPHQLSQAEETLLTERSPVGASAWTSLFDKVIDKIQFGEHKRTEEEVLSDLYNPDRTVRKQAASELTEGLATQMHVFTHIFNTLAADKMISERQRKYSHWLQSRNMSNEAEDASVEALITAVSSRYDIPQRYYRLKARLLGVDELFDYDRYAPLPFEDSGVLTWEQSRERVLGAYGEFSPEMATIAKRFFDERRIDAGVRSGKRSGAFAHPTVPSAHPYVMVNFTGTQRDVETVAHELGHGVHQYLAGRKQNLFNFNTPLTTAESASVFGEMLVFQAHLRQLSDPKAKLAAICGKLESVLATIFRQISMSKFEEKLHTARRTEGELSEERLSEMWRETQTEMFAGSVTLTEDYSTWWSYIPHFLHSPGYVYAYAFGELLVLALYRRYQQEGEPFVQKYLDLLGAGGSASPAELLKPFDIDLNDPDFWKLGLSIVEEMVQQAEDLEKEIN